MCGKSNMETYNNICKIYSQMEFSVSQETQTGALYQPREVGWGKRLGGRFKREWISVYLWLIHVEV